MRVEIQMARHVARGALIVIEGVDRSGKTTQCAMLTKRLVSEGVKAELFRFPGCCHVYVEIKAAHLFIACDPN